MNELNLMERRRKKNKILTKVLGLKNLPPEIEGRKRPKKEAATLHLAVNRVHYHIRGALLAAARRTGSLCPLAGARILYRERGLVTGSSM